MGRTSSAADDTQGFSDPSNPVCLFKILSPAGYYYSELKKSS